MSVEQIRVFHEEILEEEGVKVSELPTELQGKIRGFNLLKKRLEKNPEDEALARQLKKQAVQLGDAVQNFIENDYDDDSNDDDSDDDDSDDSDDDKSSKEKKPKSSKKDDKKPASSKKDSKGVEKPLKPNLSTGGNFGNSMMEKKIMSIMESRGDNRIRITDLEAIIGKEPNYPEQQVNNIKLRKVFLSSDYRLV